MQGFAKHFHTLSDRPQTALMELMMAPVQTGFNHLREHIFKHNFQDTMNTLCLCSLEAKGTYHFSMRCQNFLINVVRVLLFGSKSFTRDVNLSVIKSSIRFIKDSKRFDAPLFP